MPDDNDLHRLAHALMLAVGEYLGAGATGQWKVEYEIHNGEVRRVMLRHGPIADSEHGGNTP